MNLSCEEANYLINLTLSSEVFGSFLAVLKKIYLATLTSSGIACQCFHCCFFPHIWVFLFY